MDIILGFAEKIFWFCFIVGFVAFVHELGHFLVAKLFNVRVDAFAIGMGKQKLWKKQVGETEYSVRLFPIGGFVQLAQEDGLEEGEEDAGDRSFMAKSTLPKISILLAGPAMNLLATVFLLAFIFSWFGVRESAIFVTQVFENSPAARAGIVTGDVILKIDDKEIKNFDGGRDIISGAAGRELKVEVLRSRLKEFTNLIELQNYLQLKKNEESAEKPGFLLLGESTNMRIFWDMAAAMSHLSGLTTPEVVAKLSSGESAVLQMQVTPSDSGTIGVGISPYPLGSEKVRMAVPTAFAVATTATFNMTRRLFLQLGGMMINFLHRFKAPEELGGPVAIANVVSKTADEGFQSIMELMAWFCLSIGVFNLIPIPGLDGGRIMLILVKDNINRIHRVLFPKKEAIFGDNLEAYVNIFGILCVISLLVIITYKDIMKIFS
jgi:RIP metalloprotease RseP